MAVPEKAILPLSEILRGVISPATEEQDVVSRISEIIRRHHVDYLAVIINERTGSVRMNVYSDKRSEIREQLDKVSASLDNASKRLHFMFPQVQSTTPEQKRNGLMRIYDNPFSEWTIASSGPVQNIPWREPHLIPDNHGVSNLSKTASKTC